MMPALRERQPAPKAPQPEPKRCFRVSAVDTARSRRRGSRLGLASRYALRNLPPLEEEEP